MHECKDPTTKAEPFSPSTQTIWIIPGARLCTLLMPRRPRIHVSWPQSTTDFRIAEFSLQRCLLMLRSWTLSGLSYAACVCVCACVRVCVCVPCVPLLSASGCLQHRPCACSLAVLATHKAHRKIHSLQVFERFAYLLPWWVGPNLAGVNHGVRRSRRGRSCVHCSNCRLRL